MSNKFHNFFKNFLINFSSSKKCFEDLIECRKNKRFKNATKRNNIFCFFCKNKPSENMQKIGVFGLI